MATEDPPTARAGPRYDTACGRSGGASRSRSSPEAAASTFPPPRATAPRGTTHRPVDARPGTTPPGPSVRGSRSIRPRSRASTRTSRRCSRSRSRGPPPTATTSCSPRPTAGPCSTTISRATRPPAAAPWCGSSCRTSPRARPPSSTSTPATPPHPSPGIRPRCGPTTPRSGTWVTIRCGRRPRSQDSTENALHASVRLSAVPPSRADGKIGGSIALDGIDDGLNVPSFTIGTSFSYEAWIRPTATSSWRCILNDYPSYDRWFGAYDNLLDFWDGSLEHQAPANLATSAWATSRSSTTGPTCGCIATRPWSEPRSRSPSPRRPAPRRSAGPTPRTRRRFNGRLDEVRVATVARTPEYLATAYADQDAPAKFATTEPPETCP